jgi:hypothetical protein
MNLWAIVGGRLGYPQPPPPGEPASHPRSGPQIAEALRNAYHKILFPLEQQFRANIARVRASQQQQGGPMVMGAAAPGMGNMTLEARQSYPLAEIQRMAQMHQQQNAAAQYQPQRQQAPGQQPQQQTSPQVPPPMVPTTEQRHYAAQQAQRQSQQQQPPQQAGQPQPRPAQGHPPQHPGPQRFTHINFPSMGHMLAAVAMNKQQLMTQMNFTEERAEYFMHSERPLIVERIRAVQLQGQRQPQNQPPQAQPPQNQPQSGAAPTLTNGTGEIGGEAVHGTTQYLAQPQPQQHQQPSQTQAPVFRTPQPSAAQPNQQAPGTAQASTQFAPPSQPQQQQQQPSIQQQIAYSGMGRSLPTSMPPQGAPPSLQNISLQNLTLADPKFNEFKRRWAAVAPQIKQLRDHLQLNNSEYAA